MHVRRGYPPAHNIGIWTLRGGRVLVRGEGDGFFVTRPPVVLPHLPWAWRLVRVMARSLKVNHIGIIVVDNRYVALARYGRTSISALQSDKPGSSIFHPTLRDAKQLARAQAEFWGMGYIGLIQE